MATVASSAPTEIVSLTTIPPILPAFPPSPPPPPSPFSRPESSSSPSPTSRQVFGLHADTLSFMILYASVQAFCQLQHPGQDQRVLFPPHAQHSLESSFPRPTCTCESADRNRRTRPCAIEPRSPNESSGADRSSPSAAELGGKRDQPRLDALGAAWKDAGLPVDSSNSDLALVEKEESVSLRSMIDI